MIVEFLNNLNFTPFWLSIKLASISTIILLFIGTPIAWWLVNSSSRLRFIIEPLISLPLVLPPTVIGFYFLIIFNQSQGVGKFWVNLTGESLTFSFFGLIVASIIYSLPFAVQPLQNAFILIGRSPIDASTNLGAGKVDTFCNVIIPLSIKGFIISGVLSFTHTLGEFGIVLMVGGSIPGETRVLSIAILFWATAMLPLFRSVYRSSI